MTFLMFLSSAGVRRTFEPSLAMEVAVCWGSVSSTKTRSKKSPKTKILFLVPSDSDVSTRTLLSVVGKMSASFFFESSEGHSERCVG